LGLVLLCAVTRWQVEAAGDLKTAAGAEVVALRSYPGPVGPMPDVHCGCTEVLKNFA
jgi:hypothetical protein